MDKKLHLVGYASGLAGADIHAGDGPVYMQNSSILKELANEGIETPWESIVAMDPNEKDDHKNLATMCVNLANAVVKVLQAKKRLNVMGGDHTCAVGTWSGVHNVMHDQGQLGLIWIDAHMDSHTPDTSESGRIHGMPLAALLGHGYSFLTEILNAQPKLLPENVCLIGVRSYEKGEAELLKKLNVRIFLMEEVLERGFAAVMQEAIAIVTRNTACYGVSLDLDAIDPQDAPGVDVPEPNGIREPDLIKGLELILQDPRLVATEIVEFDPTKDKNQKTEKLIVKLIKMIATGTVTNARAYS